MAEDDFPPTPTLPRQGGGSSADALGAPGRATAAEHVSGYAGLELVRQGRLSIVYRATQEQPQRTVAVKVLLLDGLDQVELRRFRRECQQTGRLSSHPHVVTALDVGTTRSGRPYVAMDYFERGSLGDRLAREGPLPVEDVLRAGVEIAGALGAAHALGILHRDVRPPNILVHAGDEHALADFGIAALTDDRSQWLSPHHAAPEVLQGGPPSIAADVYSLGATLYQLLAGHSAYQGAAEAGIASLLLQITSQGPPRIGRHDVPPAVVAVIRQAMASDPQVRIPDAFAFADRLRQLQGELGLLAQADPRPALRASPAPAASEPAHAEPPAAEPRPQRPAPAVGREPASMRRTLAAAIAVAVVGFAAGLGIRQALPGLHAPSGSRSPVSATTPAPRPQASAASTPAAPAASAIDAARPTGLTAADGGTSVVLHWHLATGNRYPLFVQESSATGGPSAPRPVPNGSTTTTVRGLDSSGGYCFQVGAAVTLGQPSTVAWSAPACIRGAAAQPTATP